jgi:hypothetical protein
LKHCLYVNSLPVTFDKTIGETTYHIDPRPVHLALLCAGLSLGLLTVLVIMARRRPGAIVSPLVPTLSLAFGGITMFVYATRHLVFLHQDEHGAATVFHDAVLIDAASASVGVGTAVAAILVIALRTENQLRLLHWALPCAFFGMATTPAVKHADSIVEVGQMPHYQTRGEPVMQVGRDRDMPVQLMREPRVRFWSGLEPGPQPVKGSEIGWVGVEKVHLHSVRSAGSVRFTAEARRGPVTASTKMQVRAVPEIASPLLSLRVGDRFEYRVRAKSSDGAFLFFFTLHGSASTHDLVIEVVGTRERDGLRTFVIRATNLGSSGEDEREVEVVALDGETRLYDAERGTVGAPVVAFTGPESGPDPVACSFALLDAPSAVCQRGGRDADVAAPKAPSKKGEMAEGGESIARAPVAFAGAAPATFTRNKSGSTGRAVATAFVAIITLGIVIPPDGSSSTSYTLVATHRGPVGAPEAVGAEGAESSGGGGRRPSP